MISNKIDILEFPSNLGLKKKPYADEPGVKDLPAHLRKFGFHEKLGPDQIINLEPPKYTMHLDEESRVRNAEAIVEYARKQAKLFKHQLQSQHFQLVLGGDCSILIGNAIALKQSGNYGLFFLDGHTDYIDGNLSNTGGAAGMDLGIVTGYGNDKLTNIEKLKPYFEESHAYCVGNRYFDDDTYLQPIKNSEIPYVDINQLRAIGCTETSKQFLQMANKEHLDGFFIHLDVDVLNNEIMPAVDSPQDGGLSYEELSHLLIPLLSSPKAIGMEITILDPDLDPDGKYTKQFVQEITHIIEKSR